MSDTSPSTPESQADASSGKKKSKQIRMPARGGSQVVRARAPKAKGGSDVSERRESDTPSSPGGSLADSGLTSPTEAGNADMVS